MRWLRSDPVRKTAEELYVALVSQARRPEFYNRLGVPDSLDGRFELVVLHAFLVLRRLKSDSRGVETAQALVDLFVEDMDASLREMGAGDLGIARRVKTMAQALYGRIAAYEAALAAPEAALAEALRRNLFGTVDDPGPDAAVLARFAAYVRRESAGPALAPEGLRFGTPPDLTDGGSGGGNGD